MAHDTPLKRVRGLGSAHHGAHHWLLQRFTAIGNLVLSIWLVASMLGLPDLGYETVTGWLSQPLSATAMILLVVSTFWHARLGLQVLIEDYLHEPGTKFAALAALNLAVIGGGAFAIFSVASLAFGGAA